VAKFDCNPKAIAKRFAGDVEFFTLFIPKCCGVVNEMKKIMND
jgi:hypothetical protein